MRAGEGSFKEIGVWDRVVEGKGLRGDGKDEVVGG